MAEGVTSEREAQNCLKVKKMLLEIPGLAVKSLREDLFLISEPETDVEFTADVEEDVLFLRAEISEVKELTVELSKFLLELNGRIVHVAFGLEGNTLILKDNLEIENLDANELEASCKALILTLYNASDNLAQLLK
ncbi:MAG: hypothetical protein HQK83_15915 [Fibrobacteria bacterium]|nr:hypothetical protein [Fibrobacteria bacterium]